MSNSSPRRALCFRAGIAALAISIVLQFAWRSFVHGGPCGHRAIGVELGLLLAVIAAVLAMFGQGWQRIAVASAAMIAAVWWLSSILFLVMAC